MKSQLVYVSKRAKNCTEENIQSIVEASIQNNSHEGVTGILLYTETTFLQIIEGRMSQLLSLYDKIKLDKRHRDATLISLKPIAERKFSSWNMAAKRVDGAVEYQTNLSYEDRKEFEEILSGKQSKDAAKLIEKFVGVSATNLMKTSA